MNETFVKHLIDNINFTQEQMIHLIESISLFMKNENLNPIIDRWRIAQSLGFYPQHMNLDLKITQQDYTLYLWPTPGEFEQPDFNKVLKKISLADLPFPILESLYWDVLSSCIYSDMSKWDRVKTKNIQDSVDDVEEKYESLLKAK